MNARHTRTTTRVLAGRSIRPSRSAIFLATILAALAGCSPASSPTPTGGAGEGDAGLDDVRSDADATQDRGGSDRDGGSNVIDPAPDAARDPVPERDGGAMPAEGSPAASCFEALQSEEGEPCSFEGSCGGGDLCCGFSVHCSGGLVTERRADERCDDEPRPTGCTGTSVDIRGTTPLGPVELRFVHASFSVTPSVDVALIFGTDSELAYCGGDRLGFWLEPSSRATGSSYVGTQETIGQLVVDGEIARAPVTVEITGETRDYPWGVAGNLNVTGSGWDLSGRFDASGCAETDRSGP